MLGKLFRLITGNPRRDDFFVFWHRKREKEETHSIEKSDQVKYILKTAPYRTRGVCWDFNLGEVFEEKNSKIRKIAEVKRNYHDFWFEWVLNHPDGHDYLVCGKDYQGVTVIRLDTGERYDSGGPGKTPYGFC